MKINSFTLVENKEKKNIIEEKSIVEKKQRLVEEVQEFIDGKRLKEEYEIWAEKNKNIEFYIYLDNDKRSLFAKELYKVFDSKFHPKIDPKMVFIWNCTVRWSIGISNETKH